MRTVVPDYYKDFVCIADACRHNCCIGWEIDIDAETMRYYDSLDGEAGRRIRASVDTDGTPHFRLAERDRCPHLDERGLCRIISELGESAICEICTEHPRFRAFFRDREEIGLGMCCEEACRLILGRAAPVKLVTLSGDGDEMTDDAERKFFRRREDIFAILQNRARDIDSRVADLLEYCEASFSYTDTAEWCEFFLSLERLDGEWGSMLEALRKSEVKRLDECLCRLPGESGEQLLVYFIYRHLWGAASDGNYAVGIKFAVLAFYMIRALCAVMGEGDVSMELLCNVSRMFSSEIEYSEDNTAELLFELSL